MCNAVRVIIIIANAGILPGALYATSTPPSHLHLLFLMESRHPPTPLTV